MYTAHLSRALQVLSANARFIYFDVLLTKGMCIWMKLKWQGWMLE